MRSFTNIKSKRRPSARLAELKASIESFRYGLTPLRGGVAEVSTRQDRFSFPELSLPGSQFRQGSTRLEAPATAAGSDARLGEPLLNLGAEPVPDLARIARVGHEDMEHEPQMRVAECVEDRRPAPDCPRTSESALAMASNSAETRSGSLPSTTLTRIENR